MDHAIDGLRRWQFLLITLLFWVYVTASNVMFAHSFGLGLAPMTNEQVFASWDRRVVQHALLLPFLLGCYYWSLRIGWRPYRFAAAKQLFLAVGFALLPQPAMTASHMLSKYLPGMGMPIEWPTEPDWYLPHLGIWTASATTFLLQYGFGLALLTGFALYQRFRDAEVRLATVEKQSQSARLAALRMQLSPHTLFNLLNTIKGQIEWDPPAAQQLLVQLSDLLRRLLNAGEREFATLTDEVQFATLYLQLQRSRFADRLTITLPEGDTLPPVWVPSLILQPLIENAVQHGMRGHDGPVQISLAVTADEADLVLRLSNSCAAIEDQPDRREGIGLRNVRERLRVHFGDRAALRAERDSAALWVSEIRLPRVHSP